MRQFFLITTCCLLWGGVVQADTLNQVLSYSYENNLTLLADRTGQKITDEDVAKAKSGYRPYLSADGSVGRAHNSQEFLNSADKQTYYQNPKAVQLSLNQPIFSGLSTVNSVLSAKKKVQDRKSVV